MRSNNYNFTGDPQYPESAVLGSTIASAFEEIISKHGAFTADFNMEISLNLSVSETRDFITQNLNVISYGGLPRAGYLFNDQGNFVAIFRVHNQNAGGTLLTIKALCHHPNKVEYSHRKLRNIFKKHTVDRKLAHATITWIEDHGTNAMSQVVDDIVYPEAYPYLSKSLDEYCQEYILSDSPIILMIGPSGTGKTRLARKIIQDMCISINGGETHGDFPNIDVLYTTSDVVLGKGEFFREFISGDYDIAVLEDIDINLKSRKDYDNSFMKKLLNAGDGLISTSKNKIILTTNLIDISDIDPALIRKGRCFDVIETRLLDAGEASHLAKKINPSSKVSFAGDGVLGKGYSLADIYDAVK